MRHLLYPYQENARLGDDEEEVDDDDDDGFEGCHQFPHQENSHIDDDDEDNDHEAADVMMTVFASITCSGECQDDPIMRSPRMN